MDYSAFQATVISLRAAVDISTSLMSMKITGDVQGKVIELQSALLGAQKAALEATASQFELLDRVRELETKLQEKGDWVSTKARYRLVNPWSGPAQVYALRAETANGETPHYVCTSCFHNEKLVILNPQNKSNWIHMVCPVCSSDIETGFRGISAPTYAEE